MSASSDAPNVHYMTPLATPLRRLGSPTAPPRTFPPTVTYDCLFKWGYQIIFPYSKWGRTNALPTWIEFWVTAHKSLPRLLWKNRFSTDVNWLQSWSKNQNIRSSVPLALRLWLNRDRLSRLDLSSAVGVWCQFRRLARDADWFLKKLCHTQTDFVVKSIT